MARCLIIDESLMVRRVAARIVRDLGFDVDEARTGEEGLQLCRGNRPDVVLTDWTIGQMTAPDFLSELPAGHRPKVIFCTADRTPDRIMEALAAGADEYIMKPFDSDIIESKLILCGLLPTGGRRRAA